MGQGRDTHRGQNGSPNIDVERHDKKHIRSLGSGFIRQETLKQQEILCHSCHVGDQFKQLRRLGTLVQISQKVLPCIEGVLSLLDQTDTWKMYASESLAF